MKRQHTLDQHFLRSPRIAAELIGHSKLKKRDLVYDFGAGSGVITSALAPRVREVVAVDIDSAALEKLRAHTAQFDNVRVVTADILRVPLPVPEQPFAVFANPPFSLSAALLRRLNDADNKPTHIYLILQRQFARKIVPSDIRFTSALGICLAINYNSKIRKPLHKHDFTPPPAVDTVFVEFVQRDTPLIPLEHQAAFCRFVEACFASPRLFSATPRAHARISPERKPSELSPMQWVALWQAKKLA